MPKVKKGLNDLQTVCPEIAREWHPTKNGDLKPSDVSYGSSKKVWWLCKLGHPWEDTVAHRKQGRKCPYCSGKKVLIGFNDLATTRPDLASEWHPTKNGTLKPTDFTKGSEKKVWWICPRGHEYPARISNRTHGRGCSVCNREKNTSFPEQAIFYYLSKYLKCYNREIVFGHEADIYLPELKTVIEYDGNLYHQGEEAKRREEEKDSCFKSHGLTIVRVKERRTMPEIEVKDNIIFYKIDSEHTFLPLVLKEIFKMMSISKPISFDLDKDKPYIYESFLTYEKENSIATKNPELLKEWHPIKNGSLKPEYLRSTSSKTVWWLCPKCGYEWPKQVYKRTSGTGCPVCAGRVVKKGYNDLATLRPDLAKEWDYSQNGDLTPSDVTLHASNTVNWKCDKCHGSYPSTVNNRSNGYGCPFCAGQKVLKGFNDLETRYPELARQFSIEKNKVKPSEVYGGGSKEYFWICPQCGKPFKARIDHKIDGLYSLCKQCTGEKKSKIFGIPVMLVETGQIFSGSGEAARFLGKPSLQANINYCCQGKRKTAGGYHWIRVEKH